MNNYYYCYPVYSFNYGWNGGGRAVKYMVWVVCSRTNPQLVGIWENILIGSCNFNYGIIINLSECVIS